MDNKLIQLNKSLQTKKIPNLRAGDIVRVHKKIKEGDKERVQVFKGLVIAIKGKQSSSPTVTVRRESQGIGMEMIIPIFSPSIEKIELLRHSKVRRSKLYYMRDRTGKSAKMKAKDFKEGELDKEDNPQIEDSQSKQEEEKGSRKDDKKNINERKSKGTEENETLKDENRDGDEDDKKEKGRKERKEGEEKEKK